MGLPGLGGHKVKWNLFSSRRKSFVAAKWQDQESLKGLAAYYNLSNHFRFTLAAFIHCLVGN